MWKHDLCEECWTKMACAILAQARTNWSKIWKSYRLCTRSLSLAMASFTSATSFELVEDQPLSEKEIALAEMELEGSLLGSPQGYLESQTQPSPAPAHGASGLETDDPVDTQS